MGIKDWKSKIKLCELALRELHDADPHLTREGRYDYDKVPQNIRALVEVLLQEYKKMCEDCIEIYRKRLRKELEELP